jgi:hypothetical protein
MAAAPGSAARKAMNLRGARHRDEPEINIIP